MITAYHDRNDNRIHKKLYPECWVQDKHYETNIHYAHFHNIQKITSIFLEKLMATNNHTLSLRQKLHSFLPILRLIFNHKQKTYLLTILLFQGCWPVIK